MALPLQNQRRRRRVPIPQFEPGCSADPESGWNDKIKLAFRSGTVLVENGANLLSYLRTLRAHGFITAPNQNHAATSIKFGLRKELPLVGAQFQFLKTSQRVQSATSLARVWKMRVTLEINPTRMLSHVGCRLSGLRDLCSGVFPPFDEDRDQMIREETLEHTNNYFIDAEVRQATNVPRQSANEYAIRASIAFVERVLEPTVTTRTPTALGENQPIEVEFHYDWDRWAISQLETYWEFDSADAVSTVHTLARHASEISTGLSETFYMLDDLAAGSLTVTRPENAVSLSIPLGQKHTSLVIYAKSPRRVRCEVRHLKNPRTIYNRYTEISSQTTDSLENLFACITVINRLSARNRANPFLAELWRRDERGVGSVVQLTILLWHISAVSEDNGAELLRLLSPLIANGRLVANGPESHRNAVSDLVDRGVLRATAVRKRASGRVYAITRQYSNALEQLKGNMRRI